MQFVGRHKELTTLEHMYDSDRFECVVIYGRRRVGKTRLINEFLRDRNAIYHAGVQGNIQDNLQNLSRSIFQYENPDRSDKEIPIYSSFTAAMERIFSLAENERVILALDEFPYLAQAEQSLASILQNLIDQHKDTSKLMLILCGSSISFMEDKVLGYQAPLHGRRTGQIRLEPFRFADASEFLPTYTFEEKVAAYGIWGGTARYLAEVDPSMSIEQNISHTFLDTNSFLFEEPLTLLRQELREPARYNDILSAVASGASRISEIASKTHTDTATAAQYLRTLQELDLIDKEVPSGEKGNRKTLYKIADHMIRFWYRFIPANLSLISRGHLSRVTSQIMSEIPNFLSSVFEEICMDYLWKLSDTDDSMTFHDLGRWWGTNPNTHRQEEIDIVGFGNNETIYLGECKWKTEPARYSTLEDLIDRSTLFPHNHTRFFLFSKSGFTNRCRDLAASMGNVTLISAEHMSASLEKASNPHSY